MTTPPPLNLKKTIPTQTPKISIIASTINCFRYTPAKVCITLHKVILPKFTSPADDDSNYDHDDHQHHGDNGDDSGDEE